MLAGLLQLVKAAAYARELGRPTWDFAVDIAALRAAGLTDSDLRWLVCKGYVEHAAETTLAGSETRCFEHEGQLTFGPRACFVLTASGGQVVRQVRQREAAEPDEAAAPLAGPHWDAERRVLTVAGQVVKQFRVPADNQVLILAAFEESGWPPRLDDPLPPVPDVDSKRRLRDATFRLNGNQKRRLIRFHGDGSGRGLCWEVLP
jgi:hypothetical protein